MRNVSYNKIRGHQKWVKKWAWCFMFNPSTWEPGVREIPVGLLEASLNYIPSGGQALKKSKRFEQALTKDIQISMTFIAFSITTQLKKWFLNPQGSPHTN